MRFDAAHKSANIFKDRATLRCFACGATRARTCASVRVRPAVARAASEATNIEAARISALPHRCCRRRRRHRRSLLLSTRRDARARAQRRRVGVCVSGATAASAFGSQLPACECWRRTRARRLRVCDSLTNVAATAAAAAAAAAKRSRSPAFACASTMCSPAIDRRPSFDARWPSLFFALVFLICARIATVTICFFRNACFVVCGTRSGGDIERASERMRTRSILFLLASICLQLKAPLTREPTRSARASARLDTLQFTRVPP